MADTLHATLRPNATNQLGLWAVTGAASAHAALSDLTDLSYIEASAGGNPQTDAGAFGLPDAPSLGIGERITNVIVRYRAVGLVANEGSIAVYLMSPKGPQGFGQGPFGIATGEIRIDIPMQADLSPWTLADLNNSSFWALSIGETIRLLDVWVEVWTNTLPSAVPFQPSAPVTTIANPAEPYLQWLYVDSDLDVQERVDIRLFEGAGTVADPGTETARLISRADIAYSGQIISAGPWPNGDYVWAVRVKDSGSPSGTWGPWGQRTLTYALPVPSPPIMAVTPEPTPNRYMIALESAGGTYPTEQFHVERSNDSGLTWRPVTALYGIAYAGAPVIGYDYHAARMARPSVLPSFAATGYNDPIGYDADEGYNGALTVGSGPANVVRYRARSSRLYNGARIFSALTSITPESLVGDGTMWLKHPTDPTKSILIQQLANWETTSEEDQAVLRAAGRADWVVFAGRPSLERGDMEMIFAGDDAWFSFEALRSPPAPVLSTLSPLPRPAPPPPTSYLFQSCWGDTVLEQMWIRLGPNRSMVRQTTGPAQHTTQYRRVKVGFAQTRALA